MNWDRLQELREEVGEDAFDEVLDLFLAETDEKVSELSASPTPATLGSDMHFLKGAALNLGFDELATACQEAESLAANGRTDAVDLASILDCYAANRAALVASRERLCA